jgi:Fic family protein
LGWPGFSWDNNQIAGILAEVRNKQGRLLGKTDSLSQTLKQEASTMHLYNHPEIWTDITIHNQLPLSTERIWDWHKLLFPSGRSGLYRIDVGAWRKNPTDRPKEIISGSPGQEIIHFVAPPSESLEKEMNRFINWFNTRFQIDPIIKAGITLLGFNTIHPFDDGNDRIAKSAAELQLCRADQSPFRFYSLPFQIEKEKSDYFKILESTQKGPLDITGFLTWFLHCLERAIANAEETLKPIFKKSSFWEKNAGIPLNERQIKQLNRLLDGIDGQLTSSSWAAICSCSPDTALRDIQDLLNKRILVKGIGGGRSTHYSIMN